ncbi:MAG: thioredoxin domain-containing protein [Spirochaetia bacterium]|nr:thioredoxin domain-containing protein [Spirochaetia bacterium]
MKKIMDFLPTSLGIIQIILLTVLIVQVNNLTPGRPNSPNVPNNRPPGPPQAQRPAPGAVVTEDMNELIKGAQAKGASNGKVTIVKYNSFTCGFCNKVKSVLNELIKKYPNDVKVVYKHFNRNEIDIKTGEAIECAGEQGKFWPMYEEIFNKGANGNLPSYAKTIGIDPAKFNSCLSSGKYKNKTIEDTNEGRKFGITGTPGFVINGKLHVGFRPLEAFEALIKSEL